MARTYRKMLTYTPDPHEHGDGTYTVQTQRDGTPSGYGPSGRHGGLTMHEHVCGIWDDCRPITGRDRRRQRRVVKRSERQAVARMIRDEAGIDPLPPHHIVTERDARYGRDLMEAEPVRAWPLLPPYEDGLPWWQTMHAADLSDRIMDDLLTAWTFTPAADEPCWLCGSRFGNRCDCDL